MFLDRSGLMLDGDGALRKVVRGHAAIEAAGREVEMARKGERAGVYRRRAAAKAAAKMAPLAATTTVAKPRIREGFVAVEHDEAFLRSMDAYNARMAREAAERVAAQLLASQKQSLKALAIAAVAHRTKVMLTRQQKWWTPLLLKIPIVARTAWRSRVVELKRQLASATAEMDRKFFSGEGWSWGDVDTDEGDEIRRLRRSIGKYEQKLKPLGLRKLIKFTAPVVVPKPKLSRKEQEAALLASFVAEIQAVPDYLVPAAPEAYTQPKEEINSVRFGNLRLCEGDSQLRQANKDIRDFVTDLGCRLSADAGAVFIPLVGPRVRKSKGYAFVKMASAAEAQRLLRKMAEIAGGPMLLDKATRTARAIFPELAASKTKSTAQMAADAAAAKAKEAEAKRAKDGIRAAMKGTVAFKTSASPLAPINLGATAKARKEAEAAEAAAALKAKIQAMFAEALPTTVETPKALQLEVSFAAVAAMPKVEAVVVAAAAPCVDTDAQAAFDAGVFYKPSHPLFREQQSILMARWTARQREAKAANLVDELRPWNGWANEEAAFKALLKTVH